MSMLAGRWAAALLAATVALGAGAQEVKVATSVTFKGRPTSDRAGNSTSAT